MSPRKLHPQPQPQPQPSSLARLLARRRKVWKRRFYRGRGRFRWWGRLSSRFITTLVGLGAFVVLSTGFLVRGALNYFESVMDEQVAAGQRAIAIAQPLYRGFVQAKRDAFEHLAHRLATASRTVSADGLPSFFEAAIAEHHELLAVRWRVDGHKGAPVSAGQELPAASGDERLTHEPVEIRVDDPSRAGEFHFSFARDRGVEDRFLELANVREKLDEVEFAGLNLDRREFEVGLLWALIAAAGGVCGVALTVGWVLSRRATRKLDEIGLVVRKVTRGHLDARVSRLGDDELGELARLFNAMLDELAHMRSKVEYLQRVGIWQDMARRMAHEIKNPLTPIQLAVQQLRDKYPDGGGQLDGFGRLLHQAVDIVEDEVESLRRLVTSFSQFARVPEVRLEPTDLGRLLAEFERAYGHVSDRPEDTLRVCPHARAIEISGDRQLLKHVLANLVENAVLSCRAAGDDPIQVVIDVVEEYPAATREQGAGEDDDEDEDEDTNGEGKGVDDASRASAAAPATPEWVVLRVSDTGPGIPEDMRERVFEPYETTRPDGTGLGLAIAKKVILDHGGRISVAADVDGGARIEIRLPVAQSTKGLR